MSRPAAASVQAVKQPAVKTVICLGAFLSNLSAGMFNIALVDISADLGIPVASAQWVVSIYLLVISILLPVMGRLGDIRGRRRVHNAGLFAFAAGALGCALSANAAMLLFFRVIQGIGASMYQATNMALIVSVFPREQRGRALGLMSTFVAAGSMAGPGLGGFLIQWFSWESSFWILAAAAGTVAVLAQRWIPRDTEASGGRLDIGAAVWFAAGLSTLMAAIDLGGRSSFLSLPVLLLLATSAGIAAAYAAKERLTLRRSEASGVPPAGGGLPLFANRYVTIGILITIVTYMAAFAAQLALPSVLRLAGAEPAWTGLIMIGYPLALVVTAPLGGSLSDRKGPLGILTAGLVLMSVTLLALGLAAPAIGTGIAALPVVLLGCSMGMITSPNTSIVMGTAAKEQLGMISSLLALCRNIGMMFGTAAGGLVIGGQSAGSNTSFAAVFVVCAAFVGLSCAWLLQAFRGSGKNRRRELLR